jgi:hypothetical protein
MATTEKCKGCGGSGRRTYLVSQHDDVTETGACNVCSGAGQRHFMSDEDEADYHADYW